MIPIPSKEMLKIVKMIGMIRKATSINDVADIVSKLFADAPQNVKDAVQKTIEVALSIANKKINNMEDVRELMINVARSYGVSEDQISDFVDTMLLVSNMIAEYILSSWQNQEQSKELEPEEQE